MTVRKGRPSLQRHSRRRCVFLRDDPGDFGLAWGLDKRECDCGGRTSRCVGAVLPLQWVSSHHRMRVHRDLGVRIRDTGWTKKSSPVPSRGSRHPPLAAECGPATPQLPRGWLSSWVGLPARCASGREAVVTFPVGHSDPVSGGRVCSLPSLIELFTQP